MYCFYQIKGTFSEYNVIVRSIFITHIYIHTTLQKCLCTTYTILGKIKPMTTFNEIFDSEYLLEGMFLKPGVPGSDIMA